MRNPRHDLVALPDIFNDLIDILELILNRIFGCMKSMAHPSPCGAIPANIGKSFVILPIRGTK
jgi:hypothetical protein